MNNADFLSVMEPILHGVKDYTDTKQSQLSATQLDAVNSGITSALTEQISTNTTAISSKAEDSDVVHNTGNETVRGSKTFTDVIAIANNSAISKSVNDSTLTISGGNNLAGGKVILHGGANDGTCEITAEDNASNSSTVALTPTGELLPDTNGLALGSSTRRINSINGITPHSLGFPGSTTKDLASYLVYGGTGDSTIPGSELTDDGYITVKFFSQGTGYYCCSIIQDNGLAITSGCKGVAASENNGTIAYAYATLPVIAGETVYIKIMTGITIASITWRSCKDVPATSSMPFIRPTTPDENEVWIAPANWDNLYLNYWDDAPGQFDEPNSEPIVTTIELVKNDQGYYVWDVTDPIFSSDSELFSFKFTTNDGVATDELKVLPSIKSALGGKIVTVYPNSNTIDIQDTTE